MQENEVVKEFLEKCKQNIQEVKQELRTSIDNLDNKYIHLCYKITFFDEIMFEFMHNRGGVGYYAKLYKDSKNPLNDIFSDYLSNFTEGHLITENKLYKLLDKKGV